MSRCSICSRELDQPGEPLSLDCGGDCLGCIHEAENNLGIYPSKVRPMLISGTVLQIVEAHCDSCVIEVAADRPAASFMLQIPESVGSGFLGDEWYGTFAPGTYGQFNIDFDTSADADELTQVTGFRIGDYQRGTLV